MDFDRAEVARLLEALACEHWDFWNTHIALWDKPGITYAKVSSDRQEQMDVHITETSASNHDRINTARLIASTQERSTALRQHLIDCAPVLGTHEMSFRLEFMRGEKAPAFPEEPPHNFPAVRLFLANLEVLGMKLMRDGEKHLTPTELADALGDIAERLSGLEGDNDRIFEVGSIRLNAASPVDALYICDTISGTGLVENDSLNPPQVREVFDAFITHFDMRHRYAGTAP